MAAAPESGRRWGFVAGAAVLAGVMTLLVAEGVLRAADVPPRGQIVRGGATNGPGQTKIDWVDLPQDVGLPPQPLWDMEHKGQRHNSDCVLPADNPGGGRVLMVGSSIFYGTSYAADQVMSAVLQARLSADGGTWCVHNHAQPAYVSGNKLAEVMSVVPDAVSPDVLLWEVWMNDPGVYTRMGDDAVNVHGLTVDSGGTPSFLPLPAGVNRWLFERSKLWEYAGLAFAPPDAQAYEHGWNRLVHTVLPTLQTLCEAEGCTLALVFVPKLSEPFADFEADPPRGYLWTKAWAAEQGVPTLDVAEVFGDTPPEDVRHDPCCHYNPAGHRVVGEALAGLVRRARARQGQGPAAP